ncbi:MAG: SMI1/KNR4 family protein [Planctomycetes bacterium]|jgi:hypothetical protein|nr:SMI1/KNR4 family protein [Planctomycetota bacterium]
MSVNIDLAYAPGSLVRPIEQDEVMAFQKWLHDSGYKIDFDRRYIAHLEAFHGGIPGKCYFQTSKGVGHVITRFLNFVSADHALAQYSVESTWSALSDRMGQHLMPFAELFSGDMACFDYTVPGRPRIVVWYHERSRPDRLPGVESVADDFDQFLRLLRNKP